MKVITGRNEVVAKVMFLQVSVCPQGGRVSASVHAGMPSPHQGDPPGTRKTPSPGSRLQHTVYERPVRILLECILVLDSFAQHLAVLLCVVNCLETT